MFDTLLKKGVKIPFPRSVEIGAEVDPDRISPEVVIHAGATVSGAETSIGPGCVLGAEAPVTVENCQLARGVQLKGGYFSGAVFLDGSGIGSGAHVRAGTILEEEANGAHTVGLKQTILFPYVTLGSLVNFCDVLMAGGTSRKDHSEVGSSYVHFNFTPHQDKATASLIGDVPRGVLLGERAVFLGGQGGLVGPARIAYGTVIPAGAVCRKDVRSENQLHVPAALKGCTVPCEQGVYKSIDRIVKNSLIYIGSIRALKKWYETVRVLFIRDEFDRAAHQGALAGLDLISAERIRRFEQLAGKMDYSISVLEKEGGAEVPVAEQRRFAEAWPGIRETLERPLDTVADASLMSAVEPADKTDYLAAIKNLNDGSRAGAVAWLQSIVDETADLWN